MKTYYDLNENAIVTRDSYIPKVGGNFGYMQFLKELANGEAELVPYVPPVPTWEQIRAQRNAFLSETDWAIMEDADPKPSKQAWLDYRQALRNIPQNFNNPQDVIWPQKP
jgi:hypothetical protein